MFIIFYLNLEVYYFLSVTQFQKESNLYNTDTCISIQFNSKQTSLLDNKNNVHNAIFILEKSAWKQLNVRVECWWQIDQMYEMFTFLFSSALF